MRRRLIVSLGMAAAMVVVVAGPARAARPAAGTVGPGSPFLSWTGQEYAVGATPDPMACPAEADPQNVLCDHFELTVDVEAGYWDTHTGGVDLSITWDDSEDHFDLYVYDSEGNQVAGATTGTVNQDVFVQNASGTYEVRVIPSQVTDSGYTGEAGFLVADTGGGGGTEGAGNQYFTYGTDRSNWYWIHQINQEIGPLPGGIDYRVMLPSPQAPDTLPVAFEKGEMSKKSALYFDLGTRGVTPGSTITRFGLTIAEGTGRNSSGEQPEFNSQGKTIEACRVTDLWAGGEASLWADAPGVDDLACVTGQRGGEDIAPTWTFDLTELAQPWGEDPYGNNGVMFLGVTGDQAAPQENWQLNLKLPSRDNEATTNVDEYEQTKDRTVIDLEFRPGESQLPAPPPPVLTGPVGTGRSTSFTSSSGTGFEAARAPAPNPAPAQNAAANAEPIATLPRMPWYVWLLLPAGLVAVVAVRSVLFERAAGIRPDGVIASIRRRNEHLRSGMPPASSGGGIPPVAGAAGGAEAPTEAISRIPGPGAFRSAASRVVKGGWRR